MGGTLTCPGNARGTVLHSHNAIGAIWAPVRTTPRPGASCCASSRCGHPSTRSISRSAAGRSPTRAHASDAWRVIRWERSLDLFHEVACSSCWSRSRGSSRPITCSASARSREHAGLARGLAPAPLPRAADAALRLARDRARRLPRVPDGAAAARPRARIADTVGLAGHDRGSFAGVRFNPYAAMPSLHVGWSMLAATVLFRATSRTWLRAFAVLHPVLMTLAVTQTGNHYLADSLAGALVALITLPAVAHVDAAAGAAPRARPAGVRARACRLSSAAGAARAAAGISAPGRDADPGRDHRASGSCCGSRSRARRACRSRTRATGSPWSASCTSTSSPRSCASSTAATG